MPAPIYLLALARLLWFLRLSILLPASILPRVPTAWEVPSDTGRPHRQGTLPCRPVRHRGRSGGCGCAFPQEASTQKIGSPAPTSNPKPNERKCQQPQTSSRLDGACTDASKARIEWPSRPAIKAGTPAAILPASWLRHFLGILM